MRNPFSRSRSKSPSKSSSANRGPSPLRRVNQDKENTNNGRRWPSPLRRGKEKIGGRSSPLRRVPSFRLRKRARNYDSSSSSQATAQTQGEAEDRSTQQQEQAPNNEQTLSTCERRLSAEEKSDTVETNENPLETSPPDSGENIDAELDPCPPTLKNFVEHSALSLINLSCIEEDDHGSTIQGGVKSNNSISDDSFHSACSDFDFEDVPGPESIPENKDGATVEIDQNQTIEPVPELENFESHPSGSVLGPQNDDIRVNPEIPEDNKKTLPPRGEVVTLDSSLLENFVPNNLSSHALTSILEEVKHSLAEIIHDGRPLPRLLALQGEIDETLQTEPIYRSGLNYQPPLVPWTKTVKELRDHVAEALQIPFNHATICCYRHGEDYLSETSNPTLDLAPMSPIAKISLGATRTVILRPKRLCNGERRPSPRPTTKVDLSHGSLLFLGPETNDKMTHEIKRVSHYPQQKKQQTIGSLQEEQLHSTMQVERISLDPTKNSASTETAADKSQFSFFGTPGDGGLNDVRVCISFRHVATFLTRDGRLFGKGASASSIKQLPLLHPSTGVDHGALDRMKAAFQQETKQADFDQGARYGDGFDVIPFQHISSSLFDLPDIDFDDSGFDKTEWERRNNELKSKSSYATWNGRHRREKKKRPKADSSRRSSKVQDFQSSSGELEVIQVPCVESYSLDWTATFHSASNGFVSREVDQNPVLLVEVNGDTTSGKGQHQNEEDASASVFSEKKNSLSQLGRSDKSNKELFLRADGQQKHPTTSIEENCVEVVKRGAVKGSRSATSIREGGYTGCDQRTTIVGETDSIPGEVQSYRKGNGIALLAVDLQNDFLGEDPQFLGLKLGSPIAPRRKSILKRIAELSDEVRKMGGVVFFVKSQYGAWSAPQTGSCMKEQLPGAHMRKVDCCSVGSAGSDLHSEAVQLVQDQDIVIIKEWYSAFMGTALNRHLARLGVRHVVVTGVTTNHSVKATVTSAASLGFNVILSSDGTAQFDASLQSKTEQRLAPMCTLLKKDQTLDSLVTPDPCLTRAPLSEPIQERIEIDGSFRISGFGAGDCIIVPNFLSSTHADMLLSSFTEDDLDLGLASAACQIEANSHGHVPVYRSNQCKKPWDEGYQSEEFNDVIRDVKALVELQTGHNLNYGQTLCFQNGSEHMDWHSDKNLDLRKGSFVAVLALGSERVLQLKPKKDETGSLASQTISLTHNTLLLLGPQTTRLFVNSTPPDEKSSAPHIQFTFMDVATFYSKEESKDIPALYGQGTQYGDLPDLQKAEKAQQVVQQVACSLAATYTMTVVRPGQGGSITFTIISAAVATAATAMWFRKERQKAWSQQQEKIEELFLEIDSLPMSTDEALQKILK